MSECLEALRGHPYICTIDLRSGYLQCALEKDSQRKAAIVTREGIFIPRVVMFGLKGAPAAFSNLLRQVVRDLTSYLDDIIIAGTTFDEMFQRLRATLQRLKEANLKIN